MMRVRKSETVDRNGDFQHGENKKLTEKIPHHLSADISRAFL